MLFSARWPGCFAEGLGHLQSRGSGGGWSAPCAGLKFLQRRGLGVRAAGGGASSAAGIALPGAYADRRD